MSRLSSLGYSPSASGSATERKLHPKPDPQQEEMTISQMSRLYGVSLRTLRFYEDRGLLGPRRDGSARYYRDGERARMEMILRGKKLGFTLAEISDLIGGKGGGDASDLEERLQPQQIVNQIGHLERQREEIEARLRGSRRTHTRRVQEAAA